MVIPGMADTETNVEAIRRVLMNMGYKRMFILVESSSGQNYMVGNGPSQFFIDVTAAAARYVKHTVFRELGKVLK